MKNGILKNDLVPNYMFVFENKYRASVFANFLTRSNRKMSFLKNNNSVCVRQRVI